jgi:hypothetical protein
MNASIATLSKVELHALADGLLKPEPSIVDRCIEFVLAETQGLWHGRARAKMCRRLKHCTLGLTHRTQLLSCIIGRLSNGSFSEQFKDQLRLAMHLDLPKVIAASRDGLTSQKPYVKRYAEWALSLKHMHAA